MSYDVGDPEAVILELAKQYGIPVGAGDIIPFEVGGDESWLFRRRIQETGSLGCYVEQGVYYIPVEGRVVEIYDAQKSSAIAVTEGTLGKRFTRVGGRFVIRCMEDTTGKVIAKVTEDLETILKQSKMVA